MNDNNKFKPTPEWMSKNYDMLNNWLFNGILGDCQFEIFTTGRGSMGNILGKFRMSADGLRVDRFSGRIFKIDSYSENGKIWVTRDNFAEVCKPVILMNGNYSGTEHSLLSTLAHEMCHYANKFDGWLPKKPHGREFMDWAYRISERSGGVFSVERVASAEEMKGYELDSHVADKNKRREDNKKSKLTAVLVFRKNGDVELTLTSHKDLMNEILRRNATPDRWSKRFGVISMVVFSKDPELINKLWEHNYKVDCRSYSYYTIDPIKIFGSENFIGDYNHKVMFSDGEQNDSSSLGLFEDSGNNRALELLRHIEQMDEKPENVGYHAGDLGQSESFAQYATSNRHTGHFGTGTYFVGDERKLDTLGYKDRPRHKIDFSQYNLVKITSFETGLAFHDALRDVNNKFFQQFVHEGRVDEKDLLADCKVIAVLLFKDFDGLNDLWDKARIVFDKVIELYKEYEPEYHKVANYGYSDKRTISTELISSFGYDGVDCRSCPDMDNTMFGSVIYNLKDNTKPIMERKNDEGQKVPKKCTKCGGNVCVQIKGEPVFICNKCGEYYGTVPFPSGKRLDEIVSKAIKSVLCESNEKRKMKNRIYKLTSELTSHIYSDENWRGVYDVCDAIEDAGYEVEVTVKDGGYRNSLGGNTLYTGKHDVSYWKEYLLTITSEDGVTLEGHLNCHAAGSVEDPFDRYDMSLVLY